MGHSEEEGEQIAVLEKEGAVGGELGDNKGGS